MAWAALIPAIDHAIMRAEECEFIAAEASNLAQCSVEPAYPPLVLKLAAALGGGEAKPTCAEHRPVQHRDAKPPWCKKCGLTAEFTVPTSSLWGGE